MIKTIGVIVAGTMWIGIAQVFAQSGFSVTLVDVGPPVLVRALATIEKSLGKFVDKGTLTATDRDAAMGRVTTALSIDRLAEAERGARRNAGVRVARDEHGQTEQQTREGHEHVNRAHEQIFYPAAAEAGHQAEQRAKRPTERNRPEADHQRGAMTTIVAIAATQLVLLAVWVLGSLLVRSSDARQPETRVARLRGFPSVSMLWVTAAEPGLLGTSRKTSCETGRSGVKPTVSVPVTVCRSSDRRMSRATRGRAGSGCAREAGQSGGAEAVAADRRGRWLGGWLRCACPGHRARGPVAADAGDRGDSPQPAATAIVTRMLGSARGPRTVRLLIATIGLAVLAGCAPTAPSRPSPLRIGAIFPLTGSTASDAGDEYRVGDRRQS